MKDRQKIDPKHDTNESKKGQMLKMTLCLRFMDLIKFVMCTLVSRDYVSFCKYVKHHVYPGDGERQTEKEMEKD